MTQLVDVKVPDIGGSHDVPIIELLVKVGDVVQKEDSLLTLESDKATMEVPAPQAGEIAEIAVKVGDKVSEGSLILRLKAIEGATAVPVEVEQPKQTPTPPQVQSTPSEIVQQAVPSQAIAPTSVAPAARATPATPRADTTHHTEVLVFGAGPGGYSAAFRAADLGKKVILVERYETLGGVCLNVGCIPSKALLHAAKVITEAEEMSHFGIKFSKPKVDIDALRSWKESVIGKLTKGLTGLAKQRKVDVVYGRGTFIDAHHLRVEDQKGNFAALIYFEHAIIAAGSQSTKIPGFPYDDERLMDSTGALELKSIPKHLLVIGGGIIGLEMACVYDALGSKVTVVELGTQLMPGADPDMVKPLHKRIEKRYEALYLNTKVTRLESTEKGLKATFEGNESNKAPEPQVFERVLLAVGRRPNGKLIGADQAGVHVDERGFIPVDRQQRTNIPHIFAIGDIAGDPMLAHKAVHEAKVAAEVIVGHAVAFEARTIPSVAYTDPEVAWMGLTELQAKAKGIPYEKATFPWAASGRSLAMGRDEGATKVLLDPTSRRLLGAAMVGPNAGELVAEAVLAFEMGADMHDIALSIHPHPTLSETLAMAAEMAEGTITDLYVPPKKMGK